MPNYTVPPGVFGVNFNTSGVANTDVTTTIIGAPGVGAALRIVGIVVFANQNVTGVVRLQFQGTAFGLLYGVTIGAPGAGGGSIPFLFPAPGIQLPANDPLTCTHASTVITQPMRVIAYAYTDTFT